MQIRSGMKCALAATLGMTLVLTASGAKANGRFPRGQQLLEYPDGNRLLLAATFGLVTTGDRGKNSYYICEAGFSYQTPMAGDQGYMGDPLPVLTADGSLLVNVQKFITKSIDNGCDWTKSFEQPNIFVDDIAAAPSNRNTVFAMAHSAAANSTQIYETTNAGATWAPVGSTLSMLAVGYTIDVDPADPNHLMVTGVTTYDDKGTGAFLNSTNRGMTWTLSPIPKTNILAAPYIAAVHPTDAKTVFVRTSEWIDDGAGASWANDALLMTKDGGQTWTELLRPKGMEGGSAKLLGFAVSPSGANIIAGFGDPVEGGGLNVDRTAAGIYTASAPNYSFGTDPKPSFSELVTCLTWTSRGIYLCGSPDGADKYIGFADDVSKVTSTGITKLLQTNKLEGEPTCCTGRSNSQCDWAIDCDRFQSCKDGGATPVDAGVCTMPEAGGGGAGGSTGDGGGNRGDSSAGGGGTAGAGAAGARMDGSATGGASGSGGATGGASGAGTGGTGGASTGGSSGMGGSGGDDGCGCRVGSDTPNKTGLTLLLGLVGLGGWRQSRRRQRRAA